MTKVTILVVDDELAVRDMVKVSLELAGFNVITAKNAKEAHVKVIDDRPDLVLLDWMLPGGSGIELLRRFRRDDYTKDLSIIMLTAKSSEDSLVQGLGEGADDYVVKPFSPKALVARIHSVLRRVDERGNCKVIQVRDLLLDPAAHRVSIKDHTLDIGPTEYKLLKFFMQNKEKVYSRNHIQDAVWGANVYLEQRTVDVHIRRLRKALSFEEVGNSYSELIQTVRGAGYRFSERPTQSSLHRDGL